MANTHQLKNPHTHKEHTAFVKCFECINLCICGIVNGKHMAVGTLPHCAPSNETFTVYWNENEWGGMCDVCDDDVWMMGDDVCVMMMYDDVLDYNVWWWCVMIRCVMVCDDVDVMWERAPTHIYHITSHHTHHITHHITSHPSSSHHNSQVHSGSSSLLAEMPIALSS